MKARNGTTSQCGTWRVIAAFAAILACALSLSATLFTSPALAEGDTLTVNFARYSVPDRVHDGFTDADTGTVLYCSDFYLHSPSTGTVRRLRGGRPGWCAGSEVQPRGGRRGDSTAGPG